MYNKLNPQNGGFFLKKKICLSIIYIFSSVIVAPVLLTMCFSGRINSVENKYKDNYSDNTIPSTSSETALQENVTVYNPELTENNKANSDFENYIVGVVSAEMPASFEEEALKAQAVAARTYAYRQIIHDNIKFSQINPSNFGQAYITTDEMKKRWGNNFNNWYTKIKNAVYDTSGEILVYNNAPILAAFHSTSSGITESSENVWSNKLPYLRSVESKEDENAPNFISKTTVTKEEFKIKINSLNANITKDEVNNITITERSAAGYVTKIKIGDKTFSGKDIRNVLGLRSTNFTITYDANNIIFTTKGYGHGAGMSQYGANFMAQKGSNYKQILEHYYYGVEFMHITG